MKTKFLLLGALSFCLAGTACKKDSNPAPVPNPSSPDNKDLRVRRYSYAYNTTNFLTYSYNSAKRLDSIRFDYANGNSDTVGYTYTNGGFSREGMTYLTDNDGRITLQSIPTNHEQHKGYYDTKGQLYRVLNTYTTNGKETRSTWYTWDGSGNLLKESIAYITFNDAGQRLVKDSFVTDYSGFEAGYVNTVGPKAFGFDHFGTSPVKGFWGSPDGIQHSAMLPTASQQTHYLFDIPRINAANYSSLVEENPITYTITKDSKGRIREILHDYQNKPVVETYEYYD